MRILSLFLLFVLSSFKPVAEPDTTADPNRICGKWESSEKNLVVEVYRYKDTYKAKMIRFTGGVTKDKPMESITDKNNPDPALRNRKVLGLDVVETLRYNAKSNSWEGGRIYEVQSGKYWSAAASLDNKGNLKVKVTRR
ncbi:MAG: DUF2147 domain-containing protein [Mucilaginibacter sp.]|nr:DUF2147 domain-containing protein [Mucilaginibacter sp.]